MTGVLVTGGTGKTGSALVRLLRDQGVPVRVASRTPAAGDPDAVRFDWSDPTTHQAALRGTDRVFIVPPVNSVEQLPLVRPFLAEARRLGIRRVVLLGSAIPLPGTPEMAVHVRDEPGGIVLRASGFMQNFLPPHPTGEQIRRHGEIRTSTGTSRIGWIDARDIAAAASALLADPDAEPGHRSDYLLTGPKAFSYQEAAEIITAHARKPVHVAQVTTGELAAEYRAAGMPAEFAAALAAVEVGIEAGEQDQVSTAVLDLTGRPPRTFTEFAAEHAAKWTDGGHA